MPLMPAGDCQVMYEPTKVQANIVLHVLYIPTVTGVSTAAGRY